MSAIRRKPKPTLNTKKGLARINFSKFIIALYAFACIGWITADYVLAFMYQQPVNNQTTVVVIPSIAGLVLGYYYKTLKEKESRNTHHLDENGNPFSVPEHERSDYA